MKDIVAHHERQGQRGGKAHQQRGDARGGTKPDRADAVDHAQQGERGAIEVERSDGDQPQKAAHQHDRAEPAEHRISAAAQCDDDVRIGKRRSGKRADQHHPCTAEKRPAESPAERGPDPDFTRQVARIVRDIDRPAQLVTRSGEKLDEEQRGRECPGSQQRAKIDNGEKARCVDREHRQHEVGQHALRLVDQVIADRRDGRGYDRKYHGCRRFGKPGEFFHRAGRERLVERIEPDIGDERDDPDQQRPQVTELRARLDHLRQAEMRSLRAMQRHQHRSERAAADHGKARPEQVQPTGHADRPGGQRRQMGVAHEPHRPQVPHFAVPLGQRHVIDRAGFHQRHANSPPQLVQPGILICRPIPSGGGSGACSATRASALSCIACGAGADFSALASTCTSMCSAVAITASCFRLTIS